MNRNTTAYSSALDRYLRDINRVALLTVDEEQRLAREFRDHGDRRAGGSRPTRGPTGETGTTSWWRGSSR